MTILTRARMITAAAGAAGAAVSLAIGLPLPILLGPMLGCLIAALAGVSLQGTGSLGTFMRTFLGVAIGSAVTPAVIADIPQHAATLAMVPVFVASLGGLGYVFFRKIMRYDHPTAFYSAMPGGLQDMLIFGEQAGGNVRTMSLVHATRVLVIVTAAPIILSLTLNLDLTRAPGAPASSLPALQIAIMIGAGLVGWKVAERIGMFGASILGPLILTAGLSLSGIITSRPPVEMIWAAQFFIGIAIGAKYSGITAQELRRDVVAGFLYSAMLALASVALVLLILQFSPAGTLDVWLAFLPGGQAEMAMIAIVAGADLGFVVIHHLLRIFVVILLAPIVARLTSRP